MEVPVDAPVPPARLQMDIPQLDLPLGVGGGPYLGGVAAAPQLSMDEEVIPVVQIPPQYPRQALRARLEGHVTMEFTIEPDGSVSGIQVIEAEPPRVFNAAAVTALSRWKFKPRMVDGRAVARPARQTISFNLE
jgi:protein TonB